MLSSIVLYISCAGGAGRVRHTLRYRRLMRRAKKVGHAQSRELFVELLQHSFRIGHGSNQEGSYSLLYIYDEPSMGVRVVFSALQPFAVGPDGNEHVGVPPGH